MADSLFPTFDLPTITITANNDGPAYNGSFLFDFKAGDFALDGAGAIVRSDPYQAWAQWCAKAVLTERNAYPIYDENFGCEIDQAIGESSRALAEADLERGITEGLLADPRTESVTDFAFDWQGEGVNISFTATPTVGTPQRVEVFVGG